MGRRLGLGSAADAGAIWSRWTDIVGADVAAHCRPASFKGGVLVVRVDSTVWASEMGYLAPELARRVNDAVRSAVVERVEIRVEPAGRRQGSDAVRAGRDSPRRSVPGARIKESAEDPIVALERARRAWSVRRHGG